MGIAGMFKGSDSPSKPDYGTTGPDVVPTDHDSENGTRFSSPPPLPFPHETFRPRRPCVLHIPSERH